MTDSEVRVRIAPSPTGYFHVGTARTAIFNWLYARKMGGRFFLRIEDTDRDRSKREYVDIVLDGLRWLGLDWDDEPIFQSQRFDSYKPVAQELLAEGKAYRCFCSPEELNRKRQQAQKEKRNYRYDRTCRDLTETQIRERLDTGIPFVVRLKLPSTGTVGFDDVVLGKAQKAYEDLDDFIILKSDGNAVYNFAVVVDDHDMGITHVIRGNDHVANTYLQKELYQALGFKLPVFAHVPLILRPDRSKVSKRKSDKGVTDYQQEGYLPETLLNFLALLGWSPKDDREKMSRAELIEAFSLEAINAANAIFDPEKLTWLNGEYIRDKSNHELAKLVAPILIERQFSTKYALETRWQWFMQVIGALKERCKLVSEFADKGAYFFIDEFDYDVKGVKKRFGKPGVRENLTLLYERFDNITDFTEATTEEALRELVDELDCKPAELIHPTRLAVSGLTGGPSLFLLLELVGQQQVIARMKRAVAYIEKMGE
ncbi:MAG: glutamate--tRNA ligase [candidate division Zixibacteria bacterium]|nr:glutamate--tRNA ligase [candidate division Zixibacteria bacterium]